MVSEDRWKTDAPLYIHWFMLSWFCRSYHRNVIPCPLNWWLPGLTTGIYLWTLQPYATCCFRAPPHSRRCLLPKNVFLWPAQLAMTASHCRLVSCLQIRQHGDRVHDSQQVLPVPPQPHLLCEYFIFFRMQKEAETLPFYTMDFHLNGRKERLFDDHFSCAPLQFSHKYIFINK